MPRHQPANIIHIVQRRRREVVMLPMTGQYYGWPAGKSWLNKTSSQQPGSESVRSSLGSAKRAEELREA